VNWISRGGSSATATGFFPNTSLSVIPPLLHTVLSSDGGLLDRSETTISWDFLTSCWYNQTVQVHRTVTLPDQLLTQYNSGVHSAVFCTQHSLDSKVGKVKRQQNYGYSRAPVVYPAKCVFNEHVGTYGTQRE
jgi:hypothetical protein